MLVNVCAIRQCYYHVAKKREFDLWNSGLLPRFSFMFVYSFLPPIKYVIRRKVKSNREKHPIFCVLADFSKCYLPTRALLWITQPPSSQSTADWYQKNYPLRDFYAYRKRPHFDTILRGPHPSGITFRHEMPSSQRISRCRHSSSLI